MDLFTAIDTRSSSIKLVAPGPSRAELERILLAGARAPDHGKLAPWRFTVLEGDARRVLSDAMVDFLRSEKPDATPAQLAAERDKPLRAPTIIAIAAKLIHGHKVPEQEQVHAVVAAVQNMFLAAHALGYGAMWKTGKVTEAPQVKAALGFEDDAVVVAFLYLGTNATPGPQRTPNIDNLVRWLS